MANPGFIKTFVATGAIAAYHIVKPSGVNDGEVVLAAAATDSILGVSQNVDVAIGQPCDVVLDQTANVVCGGTIPAGSLVTSDANGCAVVANPGTGVVHRVLGVALTSGVSGDIIPVMIAQGATHGL